MSPTDDDLVAAALAGLPAEVVERHLRDVGYFAEHLLDVARSGELCGGVANEYAMEADVRRQARYADAPAWVAWAESTALAEQVAAMEPE